jgi:hypothetical protein
MPALIVLTIDTKATCPGAEPFLSWRRVSEFCSLVGRGFSRDIKNASEKLSFRRICRRASVLAPLANLPFHVTKPAPSENEGTRHSAEGTVVP